MRLLAICATKCPVVFDATYSDEEGRAAGYAASGGQREFVPALARAAVAVGIAGLFMEKKSPKRFFRRPNKAAGTHGKPAGDAGGAGSGGEGRGDSEEMTL